MVVCFRVRACMHTLLSQAVCCMFILRVEFGALVLAWNPSLSWEAVLWRRWDVGRAHGARLKGPALVNSLLPVCLWREQPSFIRACSPRHS